MLHLFIFFKKDFWQCNLSNSKSFYIIPSNYKPLYAFVVMPKTVQMMPLILSLLSVFSVFFCEYLQVQYTVNWCLILWISLLILSDLQGWLTVISAPYRPRPDRVAMDGRLWWPWLHSLCVCQFTRRMDSFTQREACVRACVCECVWMHECVFLCASI